MKVVQIVPRMDSGGVERGTIEVAKYLKQRHHEPIVVSAGGRLVAELNTRQIRHITLPVAKKSPATVLTIRKLRKMIQELKPSIVHGRSRLPNWLCYLALKQLPFSSRPQFVTSVHGLHSISRYSSVITKGERIEVVSRTAKHYLLKNYPSVNRDKIRLIYRGVDPTLYCQSYRPNQAWLQQWSSFMTAVNPNGNPILTIVGRISRLKGIHDFLKVIQILNETQTPVCGVVVGVNEPRHQSYRNELQQKVSTNSALRDNVHFLGHREDVREIMTQSRLVLSLSKHPESFGRSVLEALSLGTPVIGYQHGGVGEILEQVFPQGAVPKHDIFEVVRRIRTLLEIKAKIQTHSMTLEKMCSETVMMYEELIV